MAYTVRLEPLGIEMEVEENETVLKAAFRQGIMLMHGCKEGQCASCKSILVDGDIDLLRHSTFALPDYERDQDYILLCRTLAFSDLNIELLNYDEEVLQLAIAVKEFAGHVTELQRLTHDIRRLRLHIDDAPGLRFYAGQYADLTLPRHGVTRSYSMASTPASPLDLEFLIKVYPGGAFSSALDADLKVGDAISVTGPYGICCRRDHAGPMILVGGGSGMAPLISILSDLVQSGLDRPVRFFYGARTEDDLFDLERIAELGGHLADFAWIPALSHQSGSDAWTGDTGFIHEVVERHLPRPLPDETDAYVCGPPPLIDAVIPVLRVKGLDVDRIYFDKFFEAPSQDASPIPSKE